MNILNIIKILRRWILASVFILFLVIIVIYKIKNNFITPISNNKLPVTTSFYPLYYFASQIGGEKAEIHTIIPSGVEPHDYEPTAQDIVQVEKSKLFILNGGLLEGWGDRIKSSIPKSRTLTVIAGDDIVALDPHVWLSPPLAENEVKRILKGFIQVDPKNKDFYKQNADRLLSSLRRLDYEYKQGLKDCKQKDFITSHAAFGHLAQTYGLTQVSISGLSPEAEPSSKKIAQIAQFAHTHNVKYIFFESLVSSKLSDTIATEIGAKTLTLDPIEGISDDNIKMGKNYFTVMRTNLNNLRIALECK